MTRFLLRADHGLAAVRQDLEEPDVAVLRARRRVLDVEDVLETLELDRAVHALIRSRARRQRIVDRHVDTDRAACCRRLDARYVTLHDSVTRVDAGLLANREITRLRFGDSNLRLEAARI